MNMRLPIALAFTTGVSWPSFGDNLTVLGTLTGKCTSVTAMDVVADASICMDKVVNIEFPNGRIGFAFNLKRRGESQIVTISFFGDGEKQLHLNADTAMQPIDKVHSLSRAAPMTLLQLAHADSPILIGEFQQKSPV
jgi:hypothetical protein